MRNKFYIHFVLDGLNLNRVNFLHSECIYFAQKICLLGGNPKLTRLVRSKGNEELLYHLLSLLYSYFPLFFFPVVYLTEF